MGRRRRARSGALRSAAERRLMVGDLVNFGDVGSFETRFVRSLEGDNRGSGCSGKMPGWWRRNTCDP